MLPFLFFENLDSWALGTLFGPQKMARKPAECYCEVIGGQIFLKFGTLVAGTSPKCYLFYFLKILILGRLGPFSGPKMTRKRPALTGQYSIL